MGRFRYDDNEEDEYDIDSNNDAANNGGGAGSSWEFVADPGEEGAIVAVKGSNSPLDENHFDAATTVSPADAHRPQQQQQRTVYVVMQQDPNLYRYDSDNDDDDDYGRQRRHRQQRCPRWFMGLIVAILSHIAWHAIHYGPPAPPPPQTSLQMGNEQSFEQATETTKTEQQHEFSSTTKSDSPHSHSSSWQDYLDNHLSMFMQSTRALFWDTPWHVTSWWYRYWHDEVRQRIKDYNKPQYCSVVSSLSLSSSVDARHERMERLVQMSTTGMDSDDDDDTPSLLHGVLFAKGQPLAIRAVADALHTWRPISKSSSSVHSSSSSSWSSSSPLPFPPLLLFSSAMTSGLAMKDLGTILSYVLLSADECENVAANKGRRRRRQRLRPLLHLQAASDWDQATVAQQILSHVQEWSSSSSSSSTDGGGGVVVLQHVDQLAPNVFAWLVRELSTPPPSPHGTTTSSSSSYSSSSSSLPQLYMHCQGVIFLFTSETIGKASIVRSIRQAATSTAYAAMAGKSPPLVPVHDEEEDDDDSSSTNQGYRPCDLVDSMSRQSLTLDIQHELQTHLSGGGAGSIATSMDAILPFLPLTQIDLTELVPRRLQQLWNETILSSLDNDPVQEEQRQQLVVTNAVVQALVNEQSVEYIVWKTAINGGSGTKGNNGGAAATVPRIPVTLMTFSSTGADPVERHLQAIQVHWERCLLQKMSSPDDKELTKPEAQSFSKVLLFDTVNTTTTGQLIGILSECKKSEPPAVELMTATTSNDCVEVCSFPLVSQ